MLVLSFFAFLSGIVTILSPCILPVLPIVLSGSVGGKRKPLGVVAGFIGSFSVFTLLLSTLVQAFQIPPDYPEIDGSYPDYRLRACHGFSPPAAALRKAGIPYD